MCPAMPDADVTFTPNGCVLDGMLCLVDAYFVYGSKLHVLELQPKMSWKLHYKKPVCTVDDREGDITNVFIIAIAYLWRSIVDY